MIVYKCDGCGSLQAVHADLLGVPDCKNGPRRYHHMTELKGVTVQFEEKNNRVVCRSASAVAEGATKQQALQELEQKGGFNV